MFDYQRVKTLSYIPCHAKYFTNYPTDEYSITKARFINKRPEPHR